MRRGTVYYYIQDLHTAAEFDFGQPRILDLYQDISIKGYTSNL
eukprot:SAG11_NODE_313_length_10878_cov_43.354578_15_plen_43_part_00